MAAKRPLIAYPIGLERDKCTLLKPFCPPYYKSMTEALGAFLETKFGPDGAYRSGVRHSSWRQVDACADSIPAPTAAAVEAALAYCEYIYRSYERFPAYTAPFRTVIGFQVCRVDVDFYRRFYQTGTLPEAVRACTKRALEVAAVTPR